MVWSLMRAIPRACNGMESAASLHLQRFGRIHSTYSDASEYQAHPTFPFPIRRRIGFRRDSGLPNQVGKDQVTQTCRCSMASRSALSRNATQVDRRCSNRGPDKDKELIMCTDDH